MDNHGKSDTMQDMVTAKTLATLPPYHLLPSDCLAKAAHHIDVANISRGQIVFHAGEPPQAVYYLQTGHIKCITPQPGRDEKVINLIFSGQTFGEPECLAGLGHRHATTAIATEDSILWRMEGAFWSSLMNEHAEFAHQMAILLARRSLAIETEIIASRTLTASRRLLDYFIEHAKHPRNTMDSAGETPLVLPTRKQLIAARMGMTPETFSRALRELTQSGLITVNSNCILLQNTAITELLARGSPHSTHPGIHSRTSGQHTPLAPLPQSNTAPLAKPPSVLLPEHVIIDKSGRLRMLSQRMAKSWLMIVRNIMPRQAHTILNQSLQNFEALLDELRTTLPADQTVHQAYTHLQAVWSPYCDLLKTDPASTRLRKLFDLNEKVLLAAHALTMSVEQTHATHTSRLINIAGRERMLSQRMAKFYIFQEWNGHAGINSQRCREELNKAMDEFETGLELLTHEVSDQAAIAAQLAAVAHQWHFMRSLLSLPENSDNGDSQQVIATVCTFSERLLKQMDTAIALYEQTIAA
jgi:CRP-like cAMP-binding protein